MSACDASGDVGVLAGKTVVITGAGHGLGREYALECARHGANIVVNDAGVNVEGTAANDAGPSQRVADEIRSAGGRAIGHAGDVTDLRCGEELVELAVGEFGGIDVLVNNAGIVRDSPFGKMPMADFDRVLDVHLRGTVRVTQPVYRHMIDRNRGGVIINTTSRSGLRGKRDGANYAAAKAGIIGFSNVLAIEGADHGIRVWTISPRVATRAWASVKTTSAGPMSEGLAERFTPAAVTNTLVYLASDLSAPATGRVVFASSEQVQEVRWEGAVAHVPANGVDPEELAAAIECGKILFPSEDGRTWT